MTPDAPSPGPGSTALPASIDYFGTPEDVARLGRACEAFASTGGVKQAALSAELAWYLRQRNTPLARAHAASARAAVGPVDAAWSARPQLVEAEARWLFCEAGAEEIAVAAFDDFAARGDAVGQGDALLLRAHIHYDNADPAVRAGLRARAATIYAAAGDTDRHDLVSAWQAYDATYRDAEAIAHASIALERLSTAPHAGVRAVAEWALAGIRFETSDVAASIHGYRQALALMEQCGQWRSAITVMHNIGAAYDTLHDYQSALGWFETATSQARATGWPRSEGACLMGVGNVLRLMGRFEAALEFLEQAEAKLAPVPPGRMQATLQRSLGDTHVELGNASEALRAFERAEVLVRGLDSESLLGQTLRGKAMAYSQNGQAVQAMKAAAEALRIARALGDRARQIEILCVLARIARQHGWPAPRRSAAATAAIAYLQRAIRLGNKLAGHVMPPDVLSELSRDYERVGDLRSALDAERDAAAARAITTTRQAGQSALALQVRLETDIARADAMHQRALARAEAQHVAELNAANDLLARLGQAGRAITRALSTEVLLLELRRCSRDVLPDHEVSVWLRDGSALERLELAAAFAPKTSPARLDLAVDSPIARCVADGEPRAIVGNAGSASNLARRGGPNDSPRVDAVASTLLAPLMGGPQIDGVLVFESTAAPTPGERDLSIAVSVASYVGIALTNTLAHERLERYARTDELTSIANRRTFDEILATEIARMRRSARPLSLILVDVDHFKRFNDTYGHPGGDACLRSIAACLASQCRVGVDLAARYGGEEFALVLPETSPEKALAIAERLRLEIEGLEMPHSASPVAGHVTISAGIASLVQPGEGDAASLIERADRALYAAKRGGRNRSVVDDGSAP